MKAAGKLFLAALLLLMPGAAFALDPSAPVMDLAASQGFDTSGIVTYNIPITMPPGTSGMLPALALHYDTLPADGTMGPGWRLGMSGITRCKSDPKFFCYGNSRLVAIKGENGADGTEYRQEVENFNRFFSHGGSGGVPDWFELQTKGGHYVDLGRSGDSRGPGRWFFNRLADSKGNYFTAQYGGDASYPTRIDYTANDRQGLKPYNSVRFAYGEGQRLAHIRTYAGEMLVNDYRLDYDSEGRLMRVSRCDGAGVCLAPTSFTWTTAGGKPLLATIDNGAGDVTTVTYAASPARQGQPASYPAVLLARLDRSNGSGGTAGVVTDRQGDPVYGSDGDFVGFTTNIDSDLVTGRRISVTRSASVEDGYNELSRTVQFADVVTSRIVSEYGRRVEYPGVTFLSVDKRTETQNDLDGTKMPGSQTQWRYDEFGNTVHSEQTWSDGSTIIENNTYANDTARWFLGRRLVAAAARQPAAAGLDRKSSYQYDRDTGALTEEVIEPDNKPLRLQIDLKYDAFDHRIVKITSGAGFPDMIEKAGFDARGQFQISATDATGRTESWRYDPLTGQPLAKTDYWGAKEEWTYDGFGRQLTHSMGGKVHRTRYAYCKGVNGGSEDCPQFGAYLTDETDDNSPDHLVTIYNGRGRLETAERRSDGRSAVLETRKYDPLGYVIQDCKPAANGNLACIDYTRDKLGRVVREVQPNASWSWAYHGLITERTDNRGVVLTTLTDAQKRQISQTTKDNNGVAVIQSTYDAWGNLVRRQDQQGRVTTLDYDVRGNAIAVTGPDGRVTNHRFDARGQEISAR